MRPMLAVAAAALALGLAANPALAAPAPNPAYRFAADGDTVEGRNFYLLTLLRTVPAAREALKQNPALGEIAARRAQRLAAAEACTPKPRCTVEAYRWLPQDVDAAATALAEPRLTAALAAPHMRASGAFSRHADLSDTALIAVAWRDAAAGLNHLLDVYGEGQAPRYPAIDASEFDVSKPDFAALIASLDLSLADRADPARPFFEPALGFALNLLYLNDREDAARYEPLESGLNAPALKRMGKLDWSRWRYTAILVPGDGPDTPEAALGSLGKLRLLAAVKRWREGLAPVIIVSGGNVHPSHTRFNEAEEMRRELMARYGVPADAILVEPHARHTTTNLRNAARLMFRARAPMDRDALIVSSESQVAYIERKVFIDRCMEELGYLPMSLGKRLSPFEIVFRPSTVSLHRDAMDPLDP